MSRATNYYIDLGTANTLICASQRGILINEPSVVTICSQARRIDTYAIGSAAKRMLGKTHHRLTVQRPLRDGVIADFDSTARMLKGFIKRIRRDCFWCRPRLIISLPYRTTFH